MAKINDIAEKLRADAAVIQSENPAEVPPNLRGVTVGYLTKYLGGASVRYAFTGFVFAPNGKPMSSKTLTHAQVSALYNWVSPTNDDGTWLPSMDFLKDCTEIRAFYGITPAEVIVPNVSIFDSNCGKCGRSTPHLFLGNGTVCLICYPDKDYRQQYRLDAEPD